MSNFGRGSPKVHVCVIYLKIHPLVMEIWLVGCFGCNDPLRQYFSLYRAISQRGRKKGIKTDERKMSKLPPSCPTII